MTDKNHARQGGVSPTLPGRPGGSAGKNERTQLSSAGRRATEACPDGPRQVRWRFLLGVGLVDPRDGVRLPRHGGVARLAGRSCTVSGLPATSPRPSPEGTAGGQPLAPALTSADGRPAEMAAGVARAPGEAERRAEPPRRWAGVRQGGW